MYSQGIALLVAAALASVAAAATNATLGYVTVLNQCYYSIYVQYFNPNTGAIHELATSESYSEQYSAHQHNDGNIVKVNTASDGYINGGPQIHLDFNIKGNQYVGYGMSQVLGEGFYGSHVAVVPSALEYLVCEVIDWPNGTQPLNNIYPECPKTENLTMIFCADDNE
jgi:hypothetical protein